MKTIASLLVALAGCGGFSDFQPDPPAPRPVKEMLDLYAGGGQADDVAVLANGDIVVVGCESGGLLFDPDASAPSSYFNGRQATFVARLDRTTRKAVWTRRSSSPCGAADNWTVPRVTVSSTGTIWVAAFGWGLGAFVEQSEARTLPTILLAFDENGGLGTQREIGERVRAMTALGAGRIAIAGQSAVDYTKSTAFVAAIDADGTDVWRTTLPHAHPSFVESLAAHGDNVYVGGDVESTIEVVNGVGRGREGVGFVTTLRAKTGAIASTWSRSYAGANMDDVHVAVVDGTPYVAYGVSQRVGNPWPICGTTTSKDCLPPIDKAAFSAFLVEPLAQKPAWRRVFAGSTHTSIDGIAVTRDRLAVLITSQHGELDLGRGPWFSDFFNVGMYLELATANGATRDARKLEASGEHSRIMFRRVIWDGAAFTAVGEARGTVKALLSSRALADDAPFVWRLGSP
ncbi:MAG: hypothetical protein ACKV2T_00475 [Kofleriaceae bacterium]